MLVSLKTMLIGRVGFKYLEVGGVVFEKTIVGKDDFYYAYNAKNYSQKIIILTYLL